MSSWRPLGYEAAWGWARARISVRWAWKQAEFSVLPWQRWTWPRAAVTVLWLVATAAFGLYWALLGGIGVGIGSLRGNVPSASSFLLGARYTLMGGAIVAAGPLGVWLVRRRKVWLLAFLVLIVLTGIVAGKYFADSLDAPSEEEIFGTIL